MYSDLKHVGRRRRWTRSSYDARSSCRRRSDTHGRHQQRRHMECTLCCAFYPLPSITIYSNPPAHGICHRVALSRLMPPTRSNRRESHGSRQIRQHQHRHNGLARGHRRALHHRSLISRLPHGRQVRTNKDSSYLSEPSPRRHATAESIRQTDGCICRR